MPVKFKATQKVYDRATKKTTVQNFYMRNTPTDVLITELARAIPKKQQKIRNELVSRNVEV